MEKFQFIINLKTYKQGTLKNALNIAKIIAELRENAKIKGVEIILAVNQIDISNFFNSELTIFSQHADPKNYGANTGSIIPEMLKDLNIKGTLLNHSEKRIDFIKIKDTTKILQDLDIQVCICTENLEEIKEIDKLNPTFIAIEPKELIGGDISISTSRPELIKDAVKIIKNSKLLVGAGIKTTKDVKKAIEYGAKGILVASGIVKASNIKKAILELLDGF